MPGNPDFDALYRADPDPFGVGSRWYEQRKLAVVLAALTRSRYRLAWDTAAGTGHLAAELAGRCDRVLATDASEVAISRLRSLPVPVFPGHVSVQRSALPELPDEARPADLIIVSEVLYYLDDRERAATLQMLSGRAAEILSVHWRHHPEDTHLSGADAAGELDQVLSGASFTRAVWHEDTDFVLSTHVPHPAVPAETADAP